MKKINLLLLILVCMLFVCSCEKKNNIKIIMPTGAPSLALGSFLYESTDIDYEIVMGSDPLVAAFTQGDFDIIVAPVNLGLKFYNSTSDFNYKLYKPILGCNYYVLSKNITNFLDLNNSKIVAFNENSTPGVLLKTLIKYYDIDLDVRYESSVNASNSLFLAGEYENCFTAEPSKTIIASKTNCNLISINDLWKDMAKKEYDVPQAGIFVNKNSKNINHILSKMEESISLAYTNPALLANHAKKVDSNLSSFDQTLLEIAIPNCNYITHELNKEEVSFYFEKLIELGLGKSIGGKLPDEEFYY